MSNYHKTVLLKETIDLLDIKEGKRYVDATLGGGGHAFEILRRGGVVLGLDADQEAIDYVREELRIKNQELRFEKKNLTLAKGNFKDIDEIAREYGFEDVKGIIYDLGVSSHQLDSPERGFSFQKEAVLDMRMDRDLNVRADALINVLTKGELYELLTKLGEESHAHVISERIVSARRISPIRTTTELAEIVKKAVPWRKNDKTNPATKVFQALRIAVNDEINNLKEGLVSAFEILEKNGRIAVISFHSLEDRVVKMQFKKWEADGAGAIITKKPITPSANEVEANNRARSAKLRVIEKI
jgi:16S rRNA (cytosine1402-N4)-methyltransferase